MFKDKVVKGVMCHAVTSTNGNGDIDYIIWKEYTSQELTDKIIQLEGDISVLQWANQNNYVVSPAPLPKPIVYEPAPWWANPNLPINPYTITC